jgi:putative ABC transport system ATP-binding protein
VLADLDLDVEDGEFVAVVGPSGVGKTTLLNVIGGLDTRFDGRVEVAGHALRELDDGPLSAFRGRTVGFVFQAYNLLEHLTAAENVSLPWIFVSREHGPGRRRDAGRRAFELLERVGLGERAGDRPSTMSGGERQRIALARALFLRPSLLLCDEPTGNLDEATGAVIAEVLQEAHEVEGVTVLAATHDRSLEALADRVLELRAGRLIGADGGGEAGP